MYIQQNANDFIGNYNNNTKKRIKKGPKGECMHALDALDALRARKKQTTHARTHARTLPAHTHTHTQTEYAYKQAE